MSLTKQISCVFQSQNVSEQKLEPIRLSAPPIYNEKVKIHDWQLRELSEPRDCVNFFPPKGNLYLSSYKMLGNDNFQQFTTESKSSQEEIFKEKNRLGLERKLTRIGLIPSYNLCHTNTDIESKNIDYTTTTKRDFRAFFPLKSLPLLAPPEEPQKLLNRRTLGYSLQDLEKRKGLNTFMDDDLETHRKIATLKMQRYKSSNPWSENDKGLDK